MRFNDIIYENIIPVVSIKLNLSVSFIFRPMSFIHKCILVSLAWTALPGTNVAQQTAQRPFPYTLSWKKDIPVAGVILVVASSYAIPRSKPVYTPQDVYNLNPASINGFDRAATRYYSTADDHLRTYMLAATGVAGAVTLPAMVYAGSRSSPAPRSLFWTRCTILGTMYAEGLALNLGTNEWAKKFVDRPRPYAYNTGLTYAQRTNSDYLSSFYSNTTALQWYTAGFIARVVGDLCPGSSWKYYVWGGAVLYSAVGGYLGVRSGQHFPTDVLTGALVGGLTGVLLPGWHKTTTRSGKEHDRKTTIFPGVGFAGTPQLCLVTHF